MLVSSLPTVTLLVWILLLSLLGAYLYFFFALDHLGAKQDKFGPLKDQQLSSVSSQPGSVQLF